MVLLATIKFSVDLQGLVGNYPGTKIAWNFKQLKIGSTVRIVERK